MEMHDSDALPLENQPRLKVPRSWRRRIETVFVIGMLAGGGFGLGFVFASRIGDNEAARTRADHLAEIERLQEAYGGRLAALAGRVSAAADTSQSAAATATEAANAATEAANTAKRAVNK